MKNLVKYAAVCIILGAATGTAHANSQTRSIAQQSTCTVACAPTMIKKTRRIVRVEAIPARKLTPSAAYSGKHLAKLNVKDQAYGKVLVPVRTTSRTPNYFRPVN